MDLSVIIPAYNEERRIGPTLDAYLPYLRERYGADCEVIVVVNNSTDRTEDVVRDYATRFSFLQCMVEKGRIGKGGAIIRGFRRAEGARVGYVDADGSTPPEAFEQLVERVRRGQGDIAVASRWCPGAQVTQRQPFRRRLTSRAFNLVTRVLFGLRLHDTQCGAKVLTRAMLQRVLRHIGTTQWAFDVDLLFQVKRQSGRILEVPSVWSDREGSKIAVTEASVEMLLALIRLRLVYSPFVGVVRFYDRYLRKVIPPSMP